LKNLKEISDWISEKVKRDDFYKKELNSSFWKEDRFDEKVREKLLKIAKDFYNDLKLTVTIKDIQLTGSLANYNWTDKSDLDIHVLIDFNEIDENKDLVKKALDGQRFIWNLRHKVVIRKHDVELYVQDFQEPHVASGLFSLMNNKWIKTPSYNPPSIDYKDVDKKFDGFVNDITQAENIINSSNFSSDNENVYLHCIKLKDKILKMRREGLSRDGEFSVENLVFKKLRNEGYIEKIIDLISKAYSKIYNE
jgi:hypothetical protein